MTWRAKVALSLFAAALLLHWFAYVGASRAPSAPAAVTSSSFMSVAPAMPAAIVDGPSLAKETPSASRPDGISVPVAPVHVEEKPRPSSKTSPSSKGSTWKSRMTGTATWGPFSGHVVTRLKRGTPIKVCGKLGCHTTTSWGYGPAEWTGHIADLDRSVFADICGDPSRGICKVTLYWR